MLLRSNIFVAFQYEFCFQSVGEASQKANLDITPTEQGEIEKFQVAYLTHNFLENNHSKKSGSSKAGTQLK